MRPRQPAERVRVVGPTHARSGGAEGRELSVVYGSDAAVPCVGEDAHARRRLPRPHPLPPALSVVAGFLQIV